MSGSRRRLLADDPKTVTAIETHGEVQMLRDTPHAVRYR